MNEKSAKDLSPAELRDRIDNTGWVWHHPIDLGDGVISIPKKRVQQRFERRLKLLQIPEDLTGKTVLDIGAWDGYFSFEFERRGAKVTAIDTYAWDKGAIHNFLLARERLGSKVDYKRMDVHDLDPYELGTFDIVFFAGVLYHLRDPFLALQKVRSVTKGMMICETHAMIPFMHEKLPLITFFPGDGDPNWPWKMCANPTLSWLRWALPSAGFNQFDFKYTPSARLWRKFKALVTNVPQSGRCIIHAYPDKKSV